MSEEQRINQTAVMAGVVGQVGCVTVLLVGLALGAGLWLDDLLGTKPILTILFVVGSVPVTLFISVRLSLMAAARAQRLAAKTEDNTAG